MNSKKIIISTIMITSLIFACGNDDSNENNNNNSADDNNLTSNDANNIKSGEFGSECEKNEDCTENNAVCIEFNQLGYVCTFECTDSNECPEGQEGKKCNNKGFCRP